MRRALPLIIIAPLLVLAGCGSNHSAKLPHVTGAFGQKPAVTAPKGAPAKKLLTKTLIEGTGPVTQKGQLLVAHYLGEKYRDGHVFDNSYDRKTPISFVVGANPPRVIPGWDEALVGTKVGSRVELSIPPAKGYGAKGSPDGAIKGDDTLLFVVDVLGAYAANGSASGAPQPADKTGTLPTVTGFTGKAPTISIPKGRKPPAKLVAKTLVAGKGAKLKPGQNVVYQLAGVNWDKNKSLGSTWQNGGPQVLALGSKGTLPGLEDALSGVTVGSRVLAVLPPDKAFGPQGKPDIGVGPKDTLAVVVDVLGAL